MILRRAFSAACSSSANLRIAIVGSGPAGLYACSGLIHRLPSSCRLDVFDKNPVPYGLVQFGVAPDHHDVKRCANAFERMFVEHRDRLSLFCNVDIGADVTYRELTESYDVVVLAYGASKARSLGIPNEKAKNCFSGMDFVSWYNGQPRTASPLLDSEDVVIVGNGNVAIDCARILLSKPEKLAQTDIPEYAMNTLRRSRVRNVTVMGRRGPKEASFTIKELRELLNMDDCRASCKIPNDLKEQLRDVAADLERPKRRILELMLERTVPKVPDASKTCTIEFFKRPKTIETDSNGRVSSVEVEDTQQGATYKLPCGLLIYAIGFENLLLPGLPTNENGALRMSDWCRIPSENGHVYATGWCSHRPSGVIADSQSHAVAVAEEISRDYKQDRIRPSGRDGVKAALDARRVRYVTWDDWTYIDACERRMGAILGKLREKINDVSTFLKIRDS